MRKGWGLATLLICCAGVSAGAQFGRGFGRVPPRFATAQNHDGAFSYCRGVYTSVRREPGGQGWSTDYPDADINFSIRLSELTKARVGRDSSGSPNHLVLRLTDDALFQCPFVQMSDVGTLSFEDAEIEPLREYLLKGGFLWVDDFWGDLAWEQWEFEIRRVLPESQYQIQDVERGAPVFRTLFNIDRVPQIPSIQFWRGSGGATSERFTESGTPHMRAISGANGRLMVLMTHNTDIADAWEREGEDPQYFYSFSPGGYAVGINVILYSMTH